MEDATTMASIEQGQCKQVNLVGAACIAAIHNAIMIANDQVKMLDFCLVVARPAWLYPLLLLMWLSRPLLSVKVLAKRNYGLQLCMGKVLIADVKVQGFHVEMACYQVACNAETGKEMTIPLFCGGGLALVDAICKAHGSLQPKKRKRNCKKPSMHTLTLMTSPSTTMPSQTLPSQPSTTTFGRRPRQPSMDSEDMYYTVPNMMGLLCCWEKIPEASWPCF